MGVLVQHADVPAVALVLGQHVAPHHVLAGPAGEARATVSGGSPWRRARGGGVYTHHSAGRGAQWTGVTNMLWKLRCRKPALICWRRSGVHRWGLVRYRWGLVRSESGLQSTFTQKRGSEQQFRGKRDAVSWSSTRDLQLSGRSDLDLKHPYRNGVKRRPGATFGVERASPHSPDAASSSSSLPRLRQDPVGTETQTQRLTATSEQL